MIISCVVSPPRTADVAGLLCNSGDWDQISREFAKDSAVRLHSECPCLWRCHPPQLASEYPVLLQPEKKRANTGCGDLTRPLATPNSAPVGSPLPICPLPLCPDLSASLRRLAELNVSLLVTITQLSELHPKPNSQIIPIPSLLQPAQLETFSHRMSWDLLSSRNCNQLCESFHSFLLHLFNLAVWLFETSSYSLFLLSHWIGFWVLHFRKHVWLKPLITVLWLNLVIPFQIHLSELFDRF